MRIEATITEGKSQNFLELLSQQYFNSVGMKMAIAVSGEVESPQITIQLTDPDLIVFGMLREFLGGKS
jgi:hypothetical protein